MIRGVLAGALGLAALQAVVSSDQATGRVGQLAQAVAGVVAAVLDPTVPAIPDLRQRPGGRPSAAPAVARGADTAPAPSVSPATYRRVKVPAVPGTAPA